MAKMDREVKFREWVKDLDEEKINKLAALEKSIRLLIHTHKLIGEADPALIERVYETEAAIRDSYESE